MKSLAITFMVFFTLSNSSLFAWNHPSSQTQAAMNENVSFSISTLAGEKVKDTSLLGVWQRCKVRQDSLGIYQITTGPLLKFISADSTIMNIRIGSGNTSAVIISQGKYEHPSDSIYIEYLEHDTSLQAGEDNKIRVKFLHANFIELNFSMPKYTTKEYWVRVITTEPKSL